MLGRGAGVLAPVLFACAGADCISGLFQNAIPLRSGPVTASKRAFLRRRGSSCSSPHHACQCHCATQAMRRALGLGLLRQAEAVTATRQLSRAQCHVEGLSVSEHVPEARRWQWSGFVAVLLVPCRRVPIITKTMSPHTLSFRVA